MIKDSNVNGVIIDRIKVEIRRTMKNFIVNIEKNKLKQQAIKSVIYAILFPYVYFSLWTIDYGPSHTLES